MLHVAEEFIDKSYHPTTILRGTTHLVFIYSFSNSIVAKRCAHN